MDEAAAVLEDENMGKGAADDMDRGAADDTSHTHQDAPIAVWTITPPRNAERPPDLPATLPRRRTCSTGRA